MTSADRLLELPLPSGLYASAKINDQYKVEMFAKTVCNYDGSESPGWFQITNQNDRVMIRFQTEPDAETLSQFGGFNLYRDALVAITLEIEKKLTSIQKRLENEAKSTEALRNKIGSLHSSIAD